MDYFPHNRINYYNDMRDYYQHLFDSGTITQNGYKYQMMNLNLAEHEERKTFKEKQNVNPT